ncbi:MAG: hypothetical protein ABMB14_11195 [Myxococcota bacterium]
MIAAWLVGGWLGGCSGTPVADVAPVGVIAEAPEALVDASWVVRFAPESSLGAYAQERGWVSLVMRRDYAQAVRELGPLGGLSAARAHAEAAAVYRQAALLTAYGLIEVYGKTPEPTDPVGAAHLLTVSYAITGQLPAATEADAKLAGVTGDPTAPWHAPWAAWLASGAGAPPQWPPDLSGLPIRLPAPAPGEWPELTDLPHYALPERAGSTASREMADPGALVALALWHDAAAALAAPDQVAALRASRAGYRMPIEPAPASAGPMPDELLFGSDHLVADDAAFLADLEGAAGPAAVDAHASTSLIAWLASSARVDGKVNAEKAVDLVTALRARLVARSAAVAGAESSHHRTFADVAYVGALRSLALVAEREGDREASGILRINAYEHSDKAAACPVGLLALAAWDASNRYPMRAQDILHAQSKRYPSIEIARYGLDVLGLRVGSERVGETAGM